MMLETDPSSRTLDGVQGRLRSGTRLGEVDMLVAGLAILAVDTSGILAYWLTGKPGNR